MTRQSHGTDPHASHHSSCAPDDARANASPQASVRRLTMITGAVLLSAIVVTGIMIVLMYDGGNVHAREFLELYRSNWTPGLSSTENQIALLESNSSLLANIQKEGEEMAAELLVALREKRFSKVPFAALRREDLVEVSRIMPFDEVHRKHKEDAIKSFLASDLTTYEPVLRDNFEQLANEVDWTKHTITKAGFRIPGGIVGKNLPWVIFDLTIYFNADTTVRQLEVDGMMLTLQGWQAMPNERMLRYD